ncbi:partial [Paramuricea clavata]|nr:partial [Paramuricea clavata]
MPAPFTRVLYISTPLLSGKDVVILQNLLIRSYNVTTAVAATGLYDKQTAQAVGEYKKANLIISDPLVFDNVTAALVLKQLSYDGYKDDGGIPYGYKFKIFIPVHKNRTIETEGTLMDANGEVLYRFTIRAHGALDSSGKPINQFTHNGNTPTGLVECDLNTKEPNPVDFGPYSVVRAVRGLKGNVAIGKNANDTFLSNYRSGILIHTGEWKNWNPSMNMPNSNGCLHVHPDSMKKIDDILQNKLNVKANENPFGKQPYPYRCQGIMSIQQIDGYLQF